MKIFLDELSDQQQHQQINGEQHLMDGEEICGGNFFEKSSDGNNPEESFDGKEQQNVSSGKSEYLREKLKNVTLNVNTHSNI